MLCSLLPHTGTWLMQSEKSAEGKTLPWVLVPGSRLLMAESDVGCAGTVEKQGSLWWGYLGGICMLTRIANLSSCLIN